MPIAREDFRAIWEAFNEHQILVFRDQAFDDESQMAFSRNFGALETMEAHASNNWKPGHIAVMTNLDANGDLLPLDHPSMIHRLRNEHWHTDSSFKPVAALCSLLSGRDVPPVGGNTDFASARAAYAALPEARKKALEGLTVIHRVAAPDEIDDHAYNEEQKRRLTVTHPLIRTNPVNGRKNLYVGSHAQEIVGMPREEAQRAPRRADRVLHAAAVRLQPPVAPARPRDLGQPLRAAPRDDVRQDEVPPQDAPDHGRGHGAGQRVGHDAGKRCVE